MQQEISKIQNDWMPSGVKLGLVVCPFREEYYLFEENKPEYKSFLFKQVFTHPLLPELKLNFQAILQEALNQN